MRKITKKNLKKMFGINYTANYCAERGYFFSNKEFTRFDTNSNGEVNVRHKVSTTKAEKVEKAKEKKRNGYLGYRRELAMQKLAKLGVKGRRYFDYSIDVYLTKINTIVLSAERVLKDDINTVDDLWKIYHRDNEIRVTAFCE